MPRKPKEVIEKEEIIENVEKKKTRKSTSSTKKMASSTAKTKKDSKAKETSKKSTAKNKEAKTKSDVVEKESKVKKATTKSSTKKTSASTTVKKSKPKKASTKTASTSNTKKSSTSTTKETKPKKTSTKSTTKKVATRTKKATTTRTKKAVAVPEYYDLPYHYDQTVVKVLAQTPKTLFVYWDVSNEDKEKFEKQFGPNFFNNTVPFLRVKNETNNYSFDVDVDDFANGWYLEVEDSKCDYSIELLRKQRPYTEKVIEYPIYITSSNKIETPNDRILFNTNYTSVSFKDIKTSGVSLKNMANNSSIKNIGKVYNIYDLYKKIYKNEDVDDVFDLTNPSSGNPTSTFK